MTRQNFLGASFVYNFYQYLPVFGKSKKPKQVDLTCPYCGNHQNEPVMAISSFCRKCGDHFRIQKGKAVARSGLRVSGIAPVPENLDEDEDEDTSATSSGDGAEPSVDAWLRSSRGGEARSESLTKLDSGAADEIEGETLSAAGFFGLVEEEEEDLPLSPVSPIGFGLPDDDSELESDDEEGLGSDSQAKEELAEGSMGALIGKLADEVEKKSFGEDGSKMPPNYVPPGKRGRHSDDHDRTVRCFRCNHIQNVTRYATSTQCGRCSVYISLANYEIKTDKSQVLRTRGDVIVSKKGSLRKSEIACRNLTVYGQVDAMLDCSGEVAFKQSGRVSGGVNCKKIVIEKKCDVVFTDGLFAEVVENHGTIRGDVTSSGEVTVYRNALIEGKVKARSISVRDGGKIDGENEIDPDLIIDMPLKGGFNPSVIE